MKALNKSRVRFRFVFDDVLIVLGKVIHEKGKSLRVRCCYPRENESGGYIALVPALSYYYTQGDTIDEVVRDCYARRLLVFRE